MRILSRLKQWINNKTAIAEPLPPVNPQVVASGVNYYEMGASSVNATDEIKANLVKELLAVDVPSQFHQDSFYWKWFNARRLLSNFAWDLFSANALYFYIAQNNVTAPSEISHKGLVMGEFSADETHNLIELYKQCQQVKFDGDDFKEGYFFDPNMVSVISAERGTVCDFFELSADLESYLNLLLTKNLSYLEKVMGHCWRVSTVRLFTLNPGNSQYGADHWHTDGWPLAMKKLQIYLSDIGPEQGTTEFRPKDGGEFLLTGAAGSWALFENSTVFHRAVPPKANKRPTIEISIVPALRSDPGVINAGVNAGYPWFPVEEVNSNAIPAEFKVDYVKYRAYLRTLALSPSAENYETLNIHLDQVIPRKDLAPV